MTKDEKAAANKDELAAIDYAVDFDLADFRGDIERILMGFVPHKHWEGVIDKIVENCVERLILNRAESFEAGCAHKEKQYQRLVGWAKMFRKAIAVYYLTQEDLKKWANELDEILKEVGDGK